MVILFLLFVRSIAAIVIGHLGSVLSLSIVTVTHRVRVVFHFVWFGLELEDFLLRLIETEEVLLKEVKAND